MKRCDNGHYFDSERHPICPFCGPEVSRIGETHAYIPPRPSHPGADAQFVSMDSEAPAPRLSASTPQSSALQGSVPQGSVPQGSAPQGSASQQNVTVAYWGHPGFDPIVGWLVCIDGIDKGHDYKVRRGNNTIGRDQSMDIILEDPAIARVRQAVIAYDKRTNTFMIKEGDSRGLVYLNGTPVAGSQPLRAWDKLEFGECRGQYLFLPFVGEHFQWDVDDDQEG